MTARHIWRPLRRVMSINNPYFYINRRRLKRDTTHTQCRARLMRVRHDCPDATRVCARIFRAVNDHHAAQARRSQTVTAATSGSLRNIPSMLSSLLSFAPGPRMARAPHNISRRLQRDTVARYASNSERSGFWGEADLKYLWTGQRVENP